MRRLSMIVLVALLTLIARGLPAAASTLDWEPLSMDFGIVPVGSTEYRTLTLSHPASSTGVLTIDSITLTNDRGAFDWSAPPLPADLLPGESIEVELSFAPTEFSFFMGSVRVSSNAENTPSGLTYSFMGQGEFNPCVPLPGGEAVPDPIPLGTGSSCPPTGSVALRVDDGGNAVDLACVENPGFAPEYHLSFIPSGGFEVLVGGSPWAGGLHSVDVLRVAEPTAECLVATFHRIVEPIVARSEDCAPGCSGDFCQGGCAIADWMTYHFTVSDGTLTLTHWESLDGPGGPLPDILVDRQLDVPIGPFNIPEGAPAMIVDSSEPCDIDRNGACNQQDLDLVIGVLGECEDGSSYSELADVDHDGCVTPADLNFLFLYGDLDFDGDLDRDDIDILLDRRNTPADGPWDRADFDLDGMITVLDSRQLVLACTRTRCATEDGGERGVAKVNNNFCGPGSELALLPAPLLFLYSRRKKLW